MDISVQSIRPVRHLETARLNFTREVDLGSRLRLEKLELPDKTKDFADFAKNKKNDLATFFSCMRAYDSEAEMSAHFKGFPELESCSYDSFKKEMQDDMASPVNETAML